MRKRRAVAYCRVSTDKEDQVNSLEAQREYFRTYMDEFGYELVEIYADEGITGTKKKSRKAFLKMLEDARAGKFDVLFVKDISRFARNTLDSLESVRLLKSLNIDIVFVNNQGILETGSELMFTIMSAMAQEESVNTSKRVKFGKRQNMKNGKVPNLVYGYDKVPGELFNLHINEVEARTILHMFEWYVYAGFGCLAIAKKLNQAGIRTKRGCEWTQNAVARILKNPIYIGVVINGREATKEIYSNQRIKREMDDWLVTRNELLRIVSDDLFDQAQKLMNNRYEAFHMTNERQSNKYVFSTLIKCKHCGRSFRRVKRCYANTYVRWVCSSRNGEGMEACDNAVKINEDELLEEIRNYLLMWKMDKNAIIEKTQKEYRKVCSTGQSGDVTVTELQKEEHKLQNKLSRLKDMYLNDIITMDELKEKTDMLNQQIFQLKNKLECLEKETVTDEKIEKLLNTLFKNMDQILSAETITNEMLKQVIERIEVDRDGGVDVIIKPVSQIRLGTTVPICNGST